MQLIIHKLKKIYYLVNNRGISLRATPLYGPVCTHYHHNGIFHEGGGPKDYSAMVCRKCGHDGTCPVECQADLVIDKKIPIPWVVSRDGVEMVHLSGWIRGGSGNKISIRVLGP